MSDIQIKVTENKTGGEVFSYHLQTKRNEGSWWGMEVMTAKEMRQIAAVLITKADEIEYEQMMNEPNKFCEECGKVLYDLNTVEIELNPVSIDDDPEIIYICSDCDME